MKEGIQKTHAELKEPRKADEGPINWQGGGAVTACGLKAQEKGIICVESGKARTIGEEPSCTRLQQQREERVETAQLFHHMVHHAFGFSGDAS